MGKLISEGDRSILRQLHREQKEKRYADRIKSILLLDDGYSPEEVSRVLFIDDDTVYGYKKKYQKGGINELLTDGRVLSSGKKRQLSKHQENELEAHLRNETYLAAKEIVEYVRIAYDVVYTTVGMRKLLHRMGFVYKKTKRIPGKADADQQEVFIQAYEKLKKEKDPTHPILFIDGVHPHHNSMPAYGWIKKGQVKEILANTGRERININGAINIESMKVISRQDDSINAQSTIALFAQVEAAYPKSEKIYIIADNAKYYKNKLLKEWLGTSRIEMIFLPPYSPNLNPIERLWKFFYRKILYNQYYHTYKEFVQVCTDFFDNLGAYEKELRSLITDNFQILDAKSSVL